MLCLERICKVSTSSSTILAISGPSELRRGRGLVTRIRLMLHRRLLVLIRRRRGGAIVRRVLLLVRHVRIPLPLRHGSAALRLDVRLRRVGVQWVCCVRGGHVM